MWHGRSTDTRHDGGNKTPGTGRGSAMGGLGGLDIRAGEREAREDVPVPASNQAFLFRATPNRPLLQYVQIPHLKEILFHGFNQGASWPPAAADRSRRGESGALPAPWLLRLPYAAVPATTRASAARHRKLRGGSAAAAMPRQRSLAPVLDCSHIARAGRPNVHACQGNGRIHSSAALLPGRMHGP
jgi:hypothetical protein